MLNFNDASPTRAPASARPTAAARARDATSQLPILEDATATTESPTINLVITCENRRKEIANLSS